MKILLFSDVHWSTNTSIVRSRGEKYSTRLELLIKSMNWVNDLAVKEGCDSMICLGDFFDKAQISDEESSALREIKWNKLHTAYLVGNHESSVSSLDFSTVDLFRNKRVDIVSKVKLAELEDSQILFLPYITEDNRLTLYDYIKDFNLKNKRLIIISHNDIKDAQYGGFVSKTGFSVDDVMSNCNLFLNGHIHNKGQLTSRIINVGSLTAHNFTNDSFTYEYGAWILDTKTLELTFFENPYSLNFYKLEINKEEDIKQLYKLKSNAVLSIRCLNTLADITRQVLNSIKDVIEYRLILYSNTLNKHVLDENMQLNTSDHLTKFRDFILSRDDIEDVDILKEELMEVCK